MALLAVEVIAVVGLIVILISSYLNLRTLNHEVAEVQSTSRLQQVVSERLFDQSETTASQSTFAVDRLPGGHSSPTAPGGALPDIPAHLQNWVLPQPAAVAVPSQESASATRIVIPKINVDAPIIQGVTWEDLKKGVGQLPGSAKPGERGNMYLAAHNDIYGEIFRYLEDLEPGDEYYIYTGETKFTYVVREKRIIEPTETSVMLPTTEPVATLQTCYPYLIDTHRLVVISDLIE
jgi:sortase A